jgi:hypothetical protein
MEVLHDPYSVLRTYSAQLTSPPLCQYRLNSDCPFPISVSCKTADLLLLASHVQTINRHFVFPASCNLRTVAPCPAKTLPPLHPPTAHSTCPQSNQSALSSPQQRHSPTHFIELHRFLLILSSKHLHLRRQHQQHSRRYRPHHRRPTRNSPRPNPLRSLPDLHPPRPPSQRPIHPRSACAPPRIPTTPSTRPSGPARGSGDEARG